MPATKHDADEHAVEIEKARQLVKRADAEAEAAKPLCGHVNEHWTGPEPMTCVLKRGHAGNHQAPYINLNGVKVVGQWKDAAGTPVEQIVPEPIVEPEE